MTPTNQLHLKIIEFLDQNDPNYPKRQWVQHYLGSDKPTRCISAGVIKKFARQFVTQHDLNQTQLVELLDSLYHHCSTFDELCLAACLISTKSQFSRELDPNLLEDWLNYTHGWAEVDSLCQNNFDASILLNNWLVWQNLLTKFNHSSNIHHRRASLVLLNKPLRQSDDSRLSQLAFQNIDTLLGEKEVLITKAISWLLRSLIKFHSTAVSDYLDKNKNTLPKIAIRETTRKLLTGKK